MDNLGSSDEPNNAKPRHCAAYFANVADHQPHPWFVSHEPFWCGGDMPSVVWPDKCPRCASDGSECTHEFHA